jgi:hypothetical protein
MNGVALCRECVKIIEEKLDNRSQNVNYAINLYNLPQRPRLVIDLASYLEQYLFLLLVIFGALKKSFYGSQAENQTITHKIKQ